MRRVVEMGCARWSRSIQQTQSVELGTVEGSVHSIVPEFQAGGPRHASHLHAFAGKDLLWDMDIVLEVSVSRGRGPFASKS